jgi:hypothetical protein
MTFSTRQLPDGRELRIETQQVEATDMGGSEPDPEWSFTDRHGHVHTHSSGTWHWVQDDPDEETWIDADGDEHEPDGHYQCNVKMFGSMRCGALVEPGYKYRSGSSFRQYIPGHTSYYLDDKPITEEEAKELMAELSNVYRLSSVSREDEIRARLEADPEHQRYKKLVDESNELITLAARKNETVVERVARWLLSVWRRG